jgi:hypothetical protein
MLPGYDEVLAEDSDDEFSKRTWLCMFHDVVYLRFLKVDILFPNT